EDLLIEEAKRHQLDVKVAGQGLRDRVRLREVVPTHVPRDDRDRSQPGREPRWQSLVIVAANLGVNSADNILVPPMRERDLIQRLVTPIQVQRIVHLRRFTRPAVAGYQIVVLPSLQALVEASEDVCQSPTVYKGIEVDEGLLDLVLRWEEQTSELQSRENLVCRLLL